MAVWWALRRGRRDRVKRAADAAAAAVQDVGVDHRGADVAVAQQLLDGSDVVAALQQVGGEGVAERVTGCRFGDARPANGFFHLALYDGGVQVVTATGAGVLGNVEAAGGKDPLPGPLGRGLAVLSLEGVGQLDASVSFGKVTLMLLSDA